MSAKSYHLGSLFSSVKHTLKFIVDYHERFAAESVKHHNLQKVINEKLMATYFQPIISLEDEGILGYEALNRPLFNEAFSSTEQFYDFVGQSSKLFEMEKLCRHLAVHRFDNQLTDQDYSKLLLFINVNPHVLSDPSFSSGKTLEILNHLRLQPHQIVLEVTEKGAVHDYPEFLKALTYYRNQGFRIAVDDAGTGYNSLKTLVYTQPEFIKMDRSIIHGISIHRYQQEMVDLLLDYANRVKTKVIAEGIETREDYDYLRQLGLHFGQGYFIGKPSQMVEKTPFLNESK